MAQSKSWPVATALAAKLGGVAAVTPQATTGPSA
jgi:hypothetical protein